MHPAFSILIFTTLIGIAQGAVVVFALASLFGIAMPNGLLNHGLFICTVLLIAGLGASFLHLGHKMRAWRAIMMWRTSWMSREVIILPLFIAIVGLWWLSTQLKWQGASTWLLPLLALIGAAVLWYCTAMIYACLRFIEEWASPYTVPNFVLIGLSSGLICACALAAVMRADVLRGLLAPLAIILSLVALTVRWMSVQRNAAIRHKSTLQSATGIPSHKLLQKSMGMSAGSFNTREFFHGASDIAVKNVKWIFVWLGFVLPVTLCIIGVLTQTTLPWLLAAAIQVPGLIAERWFFFAQAKHPQNLYYQVVS
jgi:sulfite dehydrogenase (quinone) subunit SoeC